MSRDFEEWILSSPLLKSVSTLALDAAALGLLDLRSAIAAAVALEACWQTAWGPRYPKRERPPVRLQAKLGKRRRLRLRLHAGAALLHGELTEGILISQRPEIATLHLRPGVPHVVAAALPGRPLTVLLSHPLFDAKPYRIGSAVSQNLGTEVAFQVPAVPISRGQFAAPRFSLSSWAPTAPDPVPHP